MKKSFLFLLVAAVAIISAQAQTKADLSETALENLDKANMLTNSGENEAAMEILNKLDKENPNNYSILWEKTIRPPPIMPINSRATACKGWERRKKPSRLITVALSASPIAPCSILNKER